MTSPERRSERTQASLLAHAARLFAAHGFEGTSLDAIAKAAKVNKAMVSYHFGGKEGLYKEVLLASIRGMAGRLEAARDTTASASERLRRFVRGLGEGFAQAPEFPFMVLREEMAGGERLEGELLKEFLGFYELDREILEAGVASGEFREVDAHAHHLSLIGGLIFFLTSQPLRTTQAGRPELPRSPLFESYVEHLTESFLRGLRPE